MSQQVIYLVFTDEEINVWDFMTLNDVLTLASASHFFSGLMVTNSTMDNLIKRRGLDINCAGRFNISFPNDLTIGMFGKVLSRLFSPENDKAVITVMSKTGRIVLDIGSALTDAEAEMPEDEEEEEEIDEAQMIYKHIEVTSCDEYDDFVPRHPIAKGAHRRGDSYFNSDIDSCANEIVPAHVSNAFNMSDIASAALEVEDNNDPNALKNKFKKKKSTMTMNKYPGVTRSFRERTEATVTSEEADD